MGPPGFVLTCAGGDVWLPGLFRHFDPEPSANLTVSKISSPISRVALYKCCPHSRVDPRGRAMTRRAHRALRNRAQNTDLVSEVDGESIDVAGHPPAVGLNQGRGPRPNDVGRIAQAVAGSTGRDSLLPTDALDGTQRRRCGRTGSRRLVRPVRARSLSSRSNASCIDTTTRSAREIGYRSSAGASAIRHVPIGSDDCACTKEDINTHPIHAAR